MDSTASFREDSRTDKDDEEQCDDQDDGRDQ